MTPAQANVVGPSATTIYCPSCGGSMRVAGEHMRLQVACPHCAAPIDPWRCLPTLGPGQAPPVYPPAPPPAPGVSPQPGKYPPGFGQPSDMWAGYSWRNRWLAGALAILLGVFGVHRFYMGFKGMGLLQVGLTVGTIGVLTPIVAVWTFIEGILCFCGAMRDADGLPLRG